jgi:hypothetical protein
MLGKPIYLRIVLFLAKARYMETNKPELTGLFKKILKGMNDATRKLVEESAASGASLVTSVNGEVKKVPAKDLLPQVTGNA